MASFASPLRAFAFAFGLGACMVARVALAADDTAYGRVLERHVRPGTVDGVRSTLVDYRALATDPDYPAALRDLASAQPDALRGDAERFAFWANAYNLLTIKTVVDRYPIASIKDAGSFLSPIWKRKVGTVAGREMTLDEIEHDILRKQLREPRVHFAIVCASLSCPDLRAEPYVAERLHAQLDEQTRAFLGNPGKGLVPGEDGRSGRVSSIFKWFADDFAPAGGVATFVRTHAPPDVAARIAQLDDAGIAYLDYDWSLNDTARAAR
ncbi:MAG: DUF547 domain-containing protein [Thermodesulfobacteriota bacterium]